MKAVFCIKTLTGLRGGAENVLAQIAHYLHQNGWDITVITFDDDNGESCYPLNGIRWVRLAIGNSQQKTRFVDMLRRVIALRREITYVAPDVAIGFMHSMFVPLAFSLIGKRIPIVGSEHIVPAHYATRKIEFILLVIASRLLCRITVSSTQILKSYPQLVAAKMVVVPNPIKCGLSEPQTQNDLLKDTYTLLAVGRFDKQKDFHTLIAAFSQLAKTHQNWVLNIVGDGAERPVLEAAILDFGLEGRVNLLGAIPYIEIHNHYNRADLFVMSSLYEAFPLSLAEVMSNGVPAVGFFECPGVNEMISSGKDGLLVHGNGDRASALAKGLDCLMSDHVLRKSFGEAAKQFATKYSIEGVGKIWEDLLLEVVRQRT